MATKFAKQFAVGRRTAQADALVRDSSGNRCQGTLPSIRLRFLSSVRRFVLESSLRFLGSARRSNRDAVRAENRIRSRLRHLS